MPSFHTLPLSGLLLLSCAFQSCQLPAVFGGSASDPRLAEVPLDTPVDDWDAYLVHDNEGTGIWTVQAYPFFERYGCPVVVGCDDRGRLILCISYSGKWTPLPIIEDGKWLGGLAHGDVDERFDGSELYTGGQGGNLYQVLGYRDGALDYRRIARFPGCELHTILAGELDPRTPGEELLVFTRPGGLYRVRPTGSDGKWQSELLEELPGRVRDALVVRRKDGERGFVEIATVARSGQLALLRIDGEGTHWSTIHEAPMGMGRLALAPQRAGRAVVLYSTLDDGRIMRHEQLEGGWQSELIHISKQGPRGLAAGRFHEDPERECVAIFGYSREVELLTRGPSGWDSKVIFRDIERGHWLGVAELDGRNATEELIASGYGGRIILLSKQGEPRP